jgi:putative methionine-R-sulfoxide reductase with GAF domain
MIDLEKVVPLGKQLLALKEKLSEDQLLAQAVEDIAHTLKIYFVGIYLVASNREWAILKAGSGEAGKRMVALNHRLRIQTAYRNQGPDFQGFFDPGTCIYSNEIQLLNWMGPEGLIVLETFDNEVKGIKYVSKQKFFGSPNLPQTRRELYIPLTVNNEVIGALEINSNINQNFSEDEIVILIMLTSYIVELIK